MTIPASTGYPHPVRDETRRFLLGLEIERRQTDAYRPPPLQPITPEQGRRNRENLLRELDIYDATARRRRAARAAARSISRAGR